MYVILVYDIGEKRVGKACKACRRYLNWVQNSVFEGELSSARLARLKGLLNRLMKEDEDSVLIYKMRDEKLVTHEIIGVEKAPIDNFF